MLRGYTPLQYRGSGLSAFHAVAPLNRRPMSQRAHGSIVPQGTVLQIRKSLKNMVGAAGFEPATPAV